MNTPLISAFDDKSPLSGPVISMQPIDEYTQAGRPETGVNDKRGSSYLLTGAVFTFMILLLLGYTGILVMDPETLPIRNVGVSGEFTHLSPPALQDRVSKVVRGGFFNVNVEMIQEALLQEPWIRDVSVKRVWPDRITVTITEQTAIARWGIDGLVNPEAEVFYPDISSFPANLPVLTGPENTSRYLLDNFEQIQAILPPGISLQQLSLSDRRSWELQLDAGPVIRLGKTGIIARMQRFLAYLPADGFGGMEHIQYIDMRYTNGFALLRKPENKIDVEGIQEKNGKEI